MISFRYESGLVRTEWDMERGPLNTEERSTKGCHVILVWCVAECDWVSSNISWSITRLILVLDNWSCLGRIRSIEIRTRVRCNDRQNKSKGVVVVVLGVQAGGYIWWMAYFWASLVVGERLYHRSQCTCSDLVGSTQFQSLPHPYWSINISRDHLVFQRSASIKGLTGLSARTRKKDSSR